MFSLSIGIQSCPYHPAWLLFCTIKNEEMRQRGTEIAAELQFLYIPSAAVGQSTYLLLQKLQS